MKGVIVTPQQKAGGNPAFTKLTFMQFFQFQIFLKTFDNFYYK